MDRKHVELVITVDIDQYLISTIKRNRENLL